MAHNPYSMFYGRGVHDAPYLSKNGEDMMIAIDHDGCRIAEAVVMSEPSRQAVHDALKAQLDEADPVRAISSFRRLFSI